MYYAIQRGSKSCAIWHWTKKRHTPTTGRVMQTATNSVFTAKIANAKCYRVLQNATPKRWAQKMS